LFDAPDQGDLANFKAQATVAQLSLGPRQAARLAPVRSAGDRRYCGRRRSTRPRPALPKTEALISQKLVRAPFDGELGVRKVEVGQYLTAGTQIVSLTDLVRAL